MLSFQAKNIPKSLCAKPFPGGIFPKPSLKNLPWNGLSFLSSYPLFPGSRSQPLAGSNIPSAFSQNVFLGPNFYLEFLQVWSSCYSHTFCPFFFFAPCILLPSHSHHSRCHSFSISQGKEGIKNISRQILSKVHSHRRILKKSVLRNPWTMPVRSHPACSLVS